MVAAGQAIPARDDVASGTRHLGYAPWHGRSVAFEVEACKYVMEQLALHAGVEIRYFTRVVGCELKNNQISGVYVCAKEGFHFIRGKAFVDGTGDADVANMAGCPLEKGREEDGLMSPASMLFIVENVDSEKFERYCKDTGDNRFRSAIAEYKKRAEWPFPFEIIICCEMPLRGRFFMNTLRQTGIDGTDSISLTKGMIEGRDKVKILLKVMQQIVPGFEKARLVQTSPVIGIRETRRIIGQYKLTVNDIANSRHFDDTIALSGYGWDMADPKRPSYQSMESRAIHLPFIEIPYRILVPQKIDNLIVAGRCVSAEWQALGPIRIIPACIAMGQAAGTAAEQVVNNSVSFKEIDIQLLQQELKAQGAILA